MSSDGGTERPIQQRSRRRIHKQHHEVPPCQSVVTLTRDYDTVRHYVDIPLGGLLAFEALAMDEMLASLGLETMDDDECP